MSKFKKLMKNNFKKFKISFKRGLKKSTIYIKTNVLFSTFILTSLLSATLVRFFTLKNYFDLSPFLADLSFVLMIGALGYFLKPKNQFKYFFTWSIIFTILCTINTVYYTNFLSYISFSLIKTSFQLAGVTDAVIENVLELKDFIYIYQVLAMIFVNKYLKKKDYYNKVSKIEHGKLRALNTLIVGLITLGFFISTLSGTDISRLNKQWNREYIVMKYGLYIYQANDLLATVQAKLNPLFGYDEAARNFRIFYKEKSEEQTKKNKYTNIFKDKNIIMIHAESMQSFLLDTSFNGNPVVPNLKKLASEGMYFSNFYAQDSVGTSSDSEFTNYSSLLPASRGTVSISYFDRQYVTTQKLLKEKGYYVFSMHGNNCSYWNRSSFHKSLGFEEFYCHKKDYEIDETLGLGLTDKSFFRQSTEIIKKISNQHSKFFGNLIMLTNHTPFNKDGKSFSDYEVNYKYTDPVTGEEKVNQYMEGTKLGYYFKSAHYADEAIGEFIEQLDEAGLLENTVLIIYGDHDAKIKRGEYLRFKNYDYLTDTFLSSSDENYQDIDYYDYELNRKVPFIIWTKDQKLSKKIKGEQTKVMGMYDVSPTLGNMFDFKNEYAIGHDIFSIDENVVVFPDGNWLTDKVYYNRSKDEFKIIDDGTTVSVDYIQKYNDYSEKAISISDSIIVYNLIKKTEEQDSIIKENER